MATENNNAKYDAEIFTNDDIDGINELRNLLKGSIPTDLNTDLNLRRWIRGWRGQLNEIEPRLRAYIENRKIAKLDAPDLLETFRKNPIYLKYFKYFAISRQTNVVNGKDNCVMLIERLENVDLNKMTKVIPCGDFNYLYFVVCEALMRQVLKQEAKSGKPSGMTIIYDMAGFNLMDYANPNSAILKISKHCFALLQDYYCDMLHQIYIVNAPSLLSLMWSLIKLFMHPATQKKIMILGSNYVEELKQRIDADVLPKRYGGCQRDPTGGAQDPDTCCPIPAQITRDDYFVARRGVDEWTVEYLKPGASFDIRKTVTPDDAKLGHQLYWQYQVNGDVEFGIVRINAKNKEKVPIKYRFTFVTPKLPEEGCIKCDEPGDYVLEFKNNSTMFFSLKLEYFVQVEKSTEM